MSVPGLLLLTVWQLSNPWLVMSTLGNFCLLGYCVVEFQYGVAFRSFQVAKVALGLGVSFLWLSIIQVCMTFVSLSCHYAVAVLSLCCRCAVTML